ncbi:MAG: proprotein convertase P-domain-containing protein [Candidatus Heimdallarchaeaceae archaeon]
MDNMKLKSKSKIYLISLSILALMLVTVIPQNTFIMPTSATSAAGTQGSNGTNYNIYDHSTTESNIYISKSDSINTVSVYVSIIHTWIGDLKIWVVSPSGLSYQIWNREGGSSDDIHQDFVITSYFNGFNCYGTWKLRVEDCASGDKGYIDYWSIAITTGIGGNSQYETNSPYGGEGGEGSVAVSRDAYYFDSTDHNEVELDDPFMAYASIYNYYVPNNVYVDYIYVKTRISYSDWTQLDVYLGYYDAVNDESVYIAQLWDKHSSSNPDPGEKTLEFTIPVNNPSYAHKPLKWKILAKDVFSWGDGSGEIREFIMAFASDRTSDTSDIKTSLNSYQLVDNTLKVIEDIKGYCNSYYLSHSTETAGKMAKALRDFTDKIIGSTGAHIKDATYEIIGNLFEVSPTDTMTEEEVRSILKNALKTSYFSPCISMLATGVISVAIALADDGSISTSEMKTIVANVIDAGIGDALEPVYGIGFAYDAWCALASVGILPSTWTLGNLIVDFIW